MLGKAATHVENVDDFKWLNSSYCPVLRQLDSVAMKEYYFKADHPMCSCRGILAVAYLRRKCGTVSTSACCTVAWRSRGPTVRRCGIMPPLIPTSIIFDSTGRNVYGCVATGSVRCGLPLAKTDDVAGADAGLILVTLSASLRSLNRIGIFFFSIYLVALEQGGHNPCLEAFGADQFEENDPVEKKHKSSFFNYWYCGICIGTFIGVTVLSYVQDDVGWGLVFGIPAVTMAIALFIFLCGTRFYRHKLPSGSPLTRIIHVFVAMFHKWNVSTSHQEKKKVAAAPEREVLEFGSRRQYLLTNQFRFLDKATVEDELDYECKTTRNWRLCTVQEVEEVKAVLGLTPIWMTCLIFGVVFAQSSTFFTKQGATMDRKIGKHFEIPAASFQCFISLSIILLLPIYDRIFVPIARNLTGNERGITFLQRIGTGMVISILSMIVAALTEIRRIKVAKENGLIDMPNATIPLSIFLLLPQYILFGIADVFTMVGMQEYFYDQMPDTMKTLGIAVFLSVLGIGNFLSSILISVTEKLSCRNKGSCWFVDNLNKAHLDYYYWLLASLSAINFCFYIFLANCYKYKNAQNNFSDQEESCRARTLLAS